MAFIADSFLIPAALGAVDALVPLAAQQMRLRWGFDGDLRELHDNLTAIQALLRKAEDPSSDPVKEWLKDLKSGISHAEKVLDELEYEAVRRKIEVRNRMRNKVRDFFSLSNPLAFRCKVVPKLKHINLQLDQIRQRENNVYLGRSYIPMTNDDVQPGEFRRTTRFIDNSIVVGRDWDFSIVINMLLGSHEKHDHFSIIAVLGMAGLGKTTLARRLYNYNDNKNMSYFDVKMWICVSDNLILNKLLTVMVEVLTGGRSTGLNAETALRKLRQNLEGKRYFLVLDDVRDTNANECRDMTDCFLDIGGAKGSKILVTTRNVEVVTAMQIVPPLTHMLDELSADASWTIFREIAFADGGPRETRSLVEIGKKLVRNCKGVPLAIKSLASLLFFKHDESEWRSMSFNETWSSVPTGPELLEKFMLTFDQLPSPSLKQCFAYCSVFPKGSDIKKDELIQLWMSLGYLHSPLESNSEMEDLGERFYNTLLHNSLLENGEMDDYKNIKSCKMPDHVHDLAVHLYEGYRLTLEPSKSKYHTVVEHLSSDFWEEKGIDIPKGNVKMLTALFPKISVEFNHTLAFGLFGDDVEKLPNSVRKFKRLGYLDLSETSIKKLPSFITKLYYLHTLKLPLDLMELPKEFHKLVNLRHWCMPDAKNSRKLMPMKIGQLMCLQTLPFFVVGEVSGRGIEQLGRLSKLRGRLHIYSLQHVKDTQEAEKANISAKSDIQELGFHWDDKSEVENDTYTHNQEKVLEGLQPHMSIRGLILENYSGRRFPLWMVSIDAPLLQNLVKIELRGCSRCEQVPSLGHLPLLEIIEMVDFEYLRCIGPKFCGPDDRRALAAEAFPALRKLTLDGMPQLQEWRLPDDTRSTVFFPRLEELNISGCPRLISVPVHWFSIQDIQELTISSLRLSDVESRNNHHRSLSIFSAYWDSKHLDSFIGNLLAKSSKSMRTLTIRGLKELCYLPNILCNLASLEKLEISQCFNLMSDIKGTEGFIGLSNLRQLSVRQCPKLTYLPKELVKQTLVTLEIDSCRDLTTVELGGLTSLENLMIKGCPGLLSCWEDWPLKTTSLRRLEIGAFSEELEYFPTNAPVSADDIQHSIQYGQPQPHASTSAFTADAKRLFSFMDLTSLHLWGWEKLTCLPELQHLTTLTELSIHSFHSLEALPDWLPNLSSLQSLELHSCKNLAILPKQPLLLRQLTIGNCPLLGKRCGKQTGEEWAKIALIPSVKFSFSAEEKRI